MLPSGERTKNARSISLLSLRQYYLVAMATYLDKLENKVQIHHRHVKRFHMVKWFYENRPVYPEIFDKIAEPQRISIY